MGEPHSKPPATVPFDLPRPGDVVDGKYKLLRVVGEGGMGIVFEAVHVKLGQRVAIKVLQPAVASRPDLLVRFEREARAAGRLRGRHVARVTDVEVSPHKLPYMVMEFLEGNDLDVELERRGYGLPVAEAVDVLLQACRAIAEAHAAGIVHRDLKPSNLFLCVESGERVVKLLDFGISKIQDEASKLTSTQLVVGTIFYMSPEQVRSAKEVDARTDIWALGVILYQLLAGVPPFVGSATSVAVSIVNDTPAPLSEKRADVPAGLEAAISKAMAKKPDARFQDVAAFAQAIAPYRNPTREGSAALGGPVRVQLPSSPGVTDPAMETARTIHEMVVLPVAPSDAGTARSAAIVPTAPGWETQETTQPRTRSGVSRLVVGALGGVALAAIIGGVVFVASRVMGPNAATPPPIESTSSVSSSTQGASLAVPAAAPAPPSEEASAAASPPRPPRPPPSDEPSASSSVSARPPAAPAVAKTGAPRRPSGASAAPTPAPPAPPAKKDKPPLVAPF